MIFGEKLSEEIQLGLILTFSLWLMLESRVSSDQELNQGMKQGLSSFANVVDKLKESDVER